MGEGTTDVEFGGCRAEDKIGDTNEVLESGKGILIGKAGGEREQEDDEVGGSGVEIESKDAGIGLLIWGRTEND